MFPFRAKRKESARSLAERLFRFPGSARPGRRPSIAAPFLRPNIIAAVIGLGCCLAAPLASQVRGGEDDFRSITGPCHLTFPRDHGPHPGYQTEWWYYTGNLAAADGRRFGFQFTVFRRQLTPDPEKEGGRAGEALSKWRTNQIYIGHAAVSDIGGRVHYTADTMARGMTLLAGASQHDGITRIRLRDWEAQIDSRSHRLQAAGEDFSYRLQLVPEKPLVLHGDAGYSRKGATPERASCYYSFTRLAVAGHLVLRGESIPVEGLGWMDQEFSSAYLEPGLAGWDWFSLQLSDGTEVMLFLLRREEGGVSAASSGTFVDGNGTSLALGREDFTAIPGARWESPRSGAVYPIGWSLVLHPLDLRLELTAAFPDQEMATDETTGVTYWEGSVSVTGTRKGASVGGHGYLEMTGRTGKGFEAPL